MTNLGSNPSRRVAALYVLPNGPYSELAHVDPWDEERDARRYPGSLPVVAHPPCARWGRLWHTDGSLRPGNDGGLFAHGLRMVRKYGGVIEHPADSRAWPAFGLPKPPKRGGWQAGICGGWSCQVYQRRYGHRAEKLTWIYYFGDAPPPPMIWEPGPPAEATVANMSGRERKLTPLPFAKALIELALHSAGVVA